MRHTLKLAALLVSVLSQNQAASDSGQWAPDEKTYLFINQFEVYEAGNQIVVGLDGGPDINPAHCLADKNTFSHMQYGTSGKSAVVTSTLQMAFFSNRRVKLYIDSKQCSIGGKGYISAVKVEP